MKIKLHIPADGLAAIKALGLRQTSPETLRLVTDHPDSSYGIGVLLRGKSGEPLGGRDFAALHQSFGAWIECDSLRTKQRVEVALVTGVTGLGDQIRVTEA
jgi:hypothetical protein